LIPNLVLIGQGVFSRRTLENRPFPLKASIAYTTLLCTNVHACDYAVCGEVDPRNFLGRFSPIRKTICDRNSEVYDVTQCGYCDPLVLKLSFSFFCEDPPTTVQYFCCLGCVK
jgi:hypothetical protein